MFHHHPVPLQSNFREQNSGATAGPRSLQILQDIFRNHPHPNFAIQTLYVDTQAYGTVTVVRWKPPTNEGSDTYSIGFNTTNLDWPALRYSVNAEGVPSTLSLSNAAGRIAHLIPYVRTPSAEELLSAVGNALRDHPESISHHIPIKPNLSFCR